MNKSNFILTQDYLKELLEYNKETGIFIWKISKKYGLKVGSIAGRKEVQGYISIQIDGIKYKAHRLAWLYCYGKFPQKNIDHINKIRNDNSIKNLREANHSENGQNRLMNKSNTSGYRNVSFAKNCNKWVARLRLNGNIVYCKFFNSAKEASLAIEEKRKELFSHNI